MINLHPLNLLHQMGSSGILPNPFCTPREFENPRISTARKQLHCKSIHFSENLVKIMSLNCHYCKTTTT